MEEKITNNTTERITGFIKKKEYEIMEEKHNHQMSICFYNIEKLLLDVINKQVTTNDDFSIYESNTMYIKKHYMGFEDKIDEFFLTFDDSECLKLSVFDRMFYNRHFMFLLPDNKLLTISAQHNSNGYIDGDATVILTASVKNIGACKGKNDINISYHSDSLYCISWTENHDAFYFLDDNGQKVTDMYRANDMVKKFDNVDIRNILKPINVIDIANKLIDNISLDSKQTKKFTRTYEK